MTFRSSSSMSSCPWLFNPPTVASHLNCRHIRKREVIDYSDGFHVSHKRTLNKRHPRHQCWGPGRIWTRLGRVEVGISLLLLRLEYKPEDQNIEPKNDIDYDKQSDPFNLVFTHVDHAERIGTSLTALTLKSIGVFIASFVIKWSNSSFESNARTTWSGSPNNINSYFITTPKSCRGRDTVLDNLLACRNIACRMSVRVNWSLLRLQ